MPDRIDVFDANGEYLYKVPKALITNFNASRHDDPNHRRVLCDNHLSGVCEAADACPNVHVDREQLHGIAKKTVHMNILWSELDAVKYQRMPAGHVIPLWAPNVRPPCVDTPSECMLLTKGAEIAIDQLVSGVTVVASECAHYLFNNVCHRASKCYFIHIARSSPGATNDTFAPVPKIDSSSLRRSVRVDSTNVAATTHNALPPMDRFPDAPSALMHAGGNRNPRDAPKENAAPVPQQLTLQMPTIIPMQSPFGFPQFPSFPSTLLAVQPVYFLPQYMTPASVLMFPTSTDAAHQM